MCKLFKHEQQETHLDTKNEKTNTLSWILGIKSILDIGRTLEYLVCILSKLHNLHKLHYNKHTRQLLNIKM
jgi:hypothetical protein